MNPKTVEEYRDYLYPLAYENDYPENPNVNRIANASRAAFMNGYRYADQFKPKPKPVEVTEGEMRKKEIEVRFGALIGRQEQLIK